MYDLVGLCTSLAQDPLIKLSLGFLCLMILGKDRKGKDIGQSTTLWVCIPVAGKPKTIVIS